jgi:hypothetical protein
LYHPESAYFDFLKILSAINQRGTFQKSPESINSIKEENASMDLRLDEVENSTEESPAQPATWATLGQQIAKHFSLFHPVSLCLLFFPRNS